MSSSSGNELALKPSLLSAWGDAQEIEFLVAGVTVDAESVESW